jgi:hypothetical protein
VPGKLQMRVAPQYWVWNPRGFDRRAAGNYFSGFVGHLADTFAGRNDGVADMRPVLERIEQLLPGTADGPAKTLMVAIYALWHNAVAPDDHRPGAAQLLAKQAALLNRPDVPSFVVGLLSGQVPEWTDDQWQTVATDRREERLRRRHLELPPGFDAALQIMGAERMLQAGRTDEALAMARFAVEELPGNQSLLAWEKALSTGAEHELDLRALILGLEGGAAAREERQNPGTLAGAESDEDKDKAAPGSATSGCVPNDDAVSKVVKGADHSPESEADTERDAGSPPDASSDPSDLSTTGS